MFYYVTQTVFETCVTLNVCYILYVLHRINGMVSISTSKMQVTVVWLGQFGGPLAIEPVFILSERIGSLEPIRYGEIPCLVA